MNYNEDFDKNYCENQTIEKKVAPTKRELHQVQESLKPCPIS